MNVVLLAILVLCAFILGACPFSVWIGKLALHKDITKYGDSNPGSSNVFRAGSKKWGIVAVVLDMGKGVPFILIAALVFGLAQPSLYFIAFAAVLGHAYSPFLGFRGGKALAVFGGALFGLQQWDVIVCMVILLILGFLFIGNDSWTTMIATVGTLIVLLFIRADFWEIVFIGGVTTLFLIKHFRDLGIHDKPGRLAIWVKSRKKAL
jgi:acyl phosphate:glycerol-3-phosphate acyltransferase